MGKPISYHVRRVLQPVSHVYGQGIGRCICVDVPEVHLDSFAYDIGRYPAAIVSAFLQDDRNGTSGDMPPAAADALRSIVHGTNDINRVGIPISYVNPHSFVLTHSTFCLLFGHRLLYSNLYSSLRRLLISYSNLSILSDMFS